MCYNIFMKHYVLTKKEKKRYKQLKKVAKTSSYKSLLIQLYFGVIDKSKIKKWLKKVKEDFPQALIIGSTTAGEIAHAKMYEGELVLSFSFFQETKLTATYTQKINAQAGQKAAKEIYTKNTKAAIVLSEGLYGEDYEAFIQSLKSYRSDVIIAGGLAGDNFALKSSYVILNDKLYEKYNLYYQ